MHIHFILHASFEKAGSINTWITKNGHTATATASYKAEPLPKPEDYDFLIIMGGPQSPTQLEKFPYLKDEILFTQTAIQHNKPILGICLGAQIIGEALGAKTESSPHKEIGCFPISLTGESSSDPIFQNFSKQFEVMHWHNDMPGLTTDAKILAASEGCPRQIIRYANKIYGLQCHLEMTAELVTGMLPHCQEDLKPGPYVQTREQILATNFAAINQKLELILDKLAAL